MSTLKKTNSLIGIIAGIIFIICASYFISNSKSEGDQFKMHKQEVMEILNFNDRLFSFRDWVFSETAWQEKKELLDEAISLADQHYQMALMSGYFLIAASIAFLLIMIIIYARRIYYGLTVAMIFIGIAMLGQGIFNPILEMAAFKENLTIKVYVKPKDIPYYDDVMKQLDEVASLTDYISYIPVYGNEWAETAKNTVLDGKQLLTENANEEFGFDKVFPGRTYFYYQNKGIFDVIHLLWSSENKLVAGAIGTFSVIIPVVKLLFSLFILLLPGRKLRSLQGFLSFIAKWSMADVFVVGAFLAYLSFSNMSPGVEMESNVLYGLYYFGGYVLISILLGTLLKKALAEKESFELHSSQSQTPLILPDNEFYENEKGDS